ncbi:MAG: EamA family transporter [Deltaproteobacteria bacterium]|nr:EamA family transporter [Deltaproteobacteria bacterium]
MHTEWWAIGLVILGTVVGSFGALLLKIGIDRIQPNLLSIIFNKRIILGIFLYVISSLFFIYALKGGELSVLYPMVSFGYIWVTINSKLFLKEYLNKYKIIGIIFIVIGIIFIGASC